MDNNDVKTDEKIYIGNGKQSKNIESIVEFTLNVTNLLENLDRFVYEYDGVKYINIKSVKRMEESFGKTHYLQIDTFNLKKS